MKALIDPRTVALVGASNKEGSLGYDMMQMIIKGGFSGGIYPINPRYEEVCGLTCYPSLEACKQVAQKEFDTGIDLCVLSVAAKRVLDQVDIAIKEGVKALVVFANCVLEDMADLEERLIEKCNNAGIALMGHNAMGFYNNDIGLRVCGFDAPLDETGNIAFISQSGSVFSTIGHNEPQLKFNMMVATGTGQVTSLADYILYAVDKPTTKVIGVYMESVRKPETFIKALRTAAERKIPIVLMKVGKSELGAAFAMSHTGGLAGDDASIQAVLEHYGVIRVDSLDEMANTLAMFSYFPEAPTKGGLVAIADSGGERNLLADDAEAVGLKYAKLSEDTMKKLQDIQEYGQEAANPLDPWGTGIDFEKIFEDSFVCMLADENAGAGIISQDMRDGYYLSKGCIDAVKQGKIESGKPVAYLTNYGGTRRAEFTKMVNDFGSPVLVGTQPGLSAIRNYLDFGKFSFKERELEKAKLLPESITKLIDENEVLKEAEAMEVLAQLGFPVAQSIMIDSAETLEKNKDKIRYPAVLKTAVEGILHKADVGGVKLRLNSYEEVLSAYKEMSERLGNPCALGAMVSFESEWIFGMKTDPIFGPLVVIGAGGIFTELLRDSIVLTPYETKNTIKNAIMSLRVYPLLDGFRGLKKVDVDKLADMVLKFSEIVAILSDRIAEIDINPVAINGDEIIALDALMIRK